MSIEANKTLVARYLATWDTGFHFLSIR